MHPTPTAAPPSVAPAAGQGPSREPIRPWMVPLLVTLLTMLVGTLPSLPGYFWDGHEAMAPLARIDQIVAVWRAGGPLQVPWLPVSCFGYGWPFFLYYAPLGHYVGALYHLAGADLGSATRLSLLTAWWLGAFACFWAAWEFGRTGAEEPHPVAVRRAWWVAAATILFSFAPYHHADVFVRVAVAESWAFAIVPLVLGTLERTRRMGWRGAPAVAVAIGLLMISHNITALYGCLYAAAWCVLRGGLGEVGWPRAARLRWLLQCGVGGALGLMLSAWFWLPTMLMKSLVAVSEAGQDWASAAALRDHALYFHQLFKEQYGPGFSEIGPYDGFAINPGLFVVATLLLGTVLALRRGALPGELRARVGTLVALGMCTLLATTWIVPWEWVPGLLRYLQFSWRLLLFVTCFAALALALVGPVLPRRVHPLLLMGVLTLVLLGIAHPGGLQVLGYEPPPTSNDQLALLLHYGKHEELLGHYAGSVEREYRPLWVPLQRVDPQWLSKHPAPPARIQAQPPGSLRVMGYRQRGAHYHWQLHAPAGATAIVHVFDFPGWELRVNGQPAAQRLGRSAEGLVQIALPAGASEVDLRFGLPPVTRRAWPLSGLGLFLWVGLWAGARLNHGRG